MQNPAVLVAISIGGGLILLWIGANYIFAVWKNNLQLPKPNQTNTTKSNAALIALGMMTTLSNPFWYMWWVTVAAGYLAQFKAINAIAVAVFYLGHISADFAWDTTLAAVTSSGGRWLSQRAYRVLIFITGGFMTYLGVSFFANALAIL